jgi:hypothetical protein
MKLHNCPAIHYIDERHPEDKVEGYIAFNDDPIQLCINLRDKSQICIRLDDIFKAIYGSIEEARDFYKDVRY